MKVKPTALALAALLLAPLPARAADLMTTSDLRSYCMSQNETTQLVCKYYLQGIVEMTMTAGLVRNELETPKDRESLARALAVCYDEHKKVMIDAVQQIFLNWANQHPKEWSSPSGFSVVDALREAWPCK
jgi:hypothetical protein